MKIFEIVGTIFVIWLIYMLVTTDKLSITITTEPKKSKKM